MAPIAKKFTMDGISLYSGDAMEFYKSWPTPIVIVSDGPYGISGFPGDLPAIDKLADWYEPHIEKWTQKSSAQTTLWFWNTEVGWATVHPVLLKHGWRYRGCHVWDKGIAHIAGNVNGKSIKKLPVVTEVCAQYVKEPMFKVESKPVTMKEWLKHEWARTGLPFSLTNQVCGVKDAATRKYFTLSHLWYYPPAEAFEKIQKYANQHGAKDGRPYFSIDGEQPIDKTQWEKFRYKFNYEHGVTNVWREPPVNGIERLKNGMKALHSNQKPLKLMKLIINLSSDKGDCVWEPFGGLCSGMVAAFSLKRCGCAAEVDHDVFKHAVARLKDEASKLDL